MDRTVSITAHRQGDGKELVGSSYTLPSSLSMPRSRVEAAWKQAKRSLEYDYNMAKVLLYPSFGASLVFLWFPYDSSKMVRSGFEDGSKVIKETKQTSLTDEGLFTYRNRQATYLVE